MHLVKVFVLAVIGALIGWLTNIVAIKLIFRPLYPVKIPIVNTDFQGLIPKRKSEIAQTIGNVIEEELLSINEIIDKIIEDEDISKVLFKLKVKISSIIEKKLPAIIPSAFKSVILGYIEDFIDSEGEDILKRITQEAIDKAATKVSIAKIVEDKINNYDMEKIESIIISIAKKELKHIEILGGVLGFFIGIIQGIIVIFL